MKVLFVGNSHTYVNDMPQIFKMLCDESGIGRVEVTMQAHPGVHLSWHLSQGAELRFALLHGGFDYMVFQQAAHPFPFEETVPDGCEMVRLARNAAITPIATVTWAEKRFPENQKKMYEAFNELHKKTGVALSPAGCVFEKAREYDDIDLYRNDGEHCSPYGSYAVAACAYGAIFNKSVQGLPCKSINGISGREENYAPIYDKEKLFVELDENKCRKLQIIIDNQLKNM